MALQLQVLGASMEPARVTQPRVERIVEPSGMFLSTLTGAIVALALVAQDHGIQVTAAGSSRWSILPVVLFIGLTNADPAGHRRSPRRTTVVGMNRIRAGVLRARSRSRALFRPCPAPDDRGSTWRAMDMDIGFPMPFVLIASAPAIIGVLNAVIAGSIGAIEAIQLGADTGLALIVAVIIFAAMFAGQMAFGRREALRDRPDFAPMFPAEPAEDADTPPA